MLRIYAACAIAPNKIAVEKQQTYSSCEIIGALIVPGKGGGGTRKKY